MCQECRQTPCHPSCPNAPELPVIYYCINCGEKIYAYDEYYELNGESWCMGCVDDSRREADPDEINN